MANTTYLDELVTIPAKILARLSEENEVVGLVVNKSFNKVEDDDRDDFLDQHVYDYQYLDSTVTEAMAFIWAEVEIIRAANHQVKDARLHVTVACHKSLMKIDGKKYPGIVGNRRDNIVRFVDRKINNSDNLGIGKLSLNAVMTMPTINGFTGRVLTYSIPEFNIVDLDEVHL